MYHKQVVSKKKKSITNRQPLSLFMRRPIISLKTYSKTYGCSCNHIEKSRYQKTTHRTKHRLPQGVHTLSRASQWTGCLDPPSYHVCSTQHKNMSHNFSNQMITAVRDYEVVLGISRAFSACSSRHPIPYRTCRNTRAQEYL
jgi:hypothetical protein